MISETTLTRKSQVTSQCCYLHKDFGTASNCSPLTSIDCILSLFSFYFSFLHSFAHHFFPSLVLSFLPSFPFFPFYFNSFLPLFFLPSFIYSLYCHYIHAFVCLFDYLVSISLSYSLYILPDCLVNSVKDYKVRP